MIKFVFCFACNGKVFHSFESEESLIRRTGSLSDSDKAKILELIRFNRSGHFVTLEEGELVFQQ